MTIAEEEILDFILAGKTPEQVMNFQPSESVKERVSDLIRREKSAALSVEEQKELDAYMHLEHLMRMAKARARLRSVGDE